MALAIVSISLIACQGPLAQKTTPSTDTMGAVAPPAPIQPTSAAVSGTAGEAPEPATTAGPTDEPVIIPTADPRSLRIYTVEDGGNLDLLRELVQGWTSSSGWSVELVHKDQASIDIDMQTAMLADQGPDLLWTTSELLATYVSSGLLQPVGSMFTPAAFAPATVAAASYQGKQWGVPVTAGNQLLMFYNKKLLATPPRTTDELLALQKPGDAEAILAYNQAGPLWLTPWLNGFGGRLLTEDQKPSLNTPEMVNTLRFLKELRDKGIVTPDMDFEQAGDLFRAGKIALMIDGDWALPSYSGVDEAVPDLDLGIAPLPLVSSTRRSAGAFASGVYLFVPKSSAGEKLAATRALISYLTSPEVQVRFATGLHRLPALLATLQTPIVQDDPQLRPRADALALGMPTLVQPQMAGIWDAIQTHIGAALAGTVPLDTTAQDMQAAAEGGGGGQ